MKAFLRRTFVTVALTHGTGADKETIEFRVVPLPLGYWSLVDTWIPEPKGAPKFQGGKEIPTEADPGARRRCGLARNLCRLGKALGDQVDTRRPQDGASETEWYAYSDALYAEMEGAGLNDRDLSNLLEGLSQAQSGEGELDPKA